MREKEYFPLFPFFSFFLIQFQLCIQTEIFKEEGSDNFWTYNINIYIRCKWWVA